MQTLGIVLLLSMLSIAPARAEICIDWLETWQSKPAGATFVGCADEPAAEGESPASLYRLAAGAAEPAEALLIKQFGMAPLSFVCCGWEPPRKGYREGDGQTYEITLYSAETLANRREDWAGVEFFIRVQPLGEL